MSGHSEPEAALEPDAGQESSLVKTARSPNTVGMTSKLAEESHSELGPTNRMKRAPDQAMMMGIANSVTGSSA